LTFKATLSKKKKFISDESMLEMKNN